VAEAEAPLVIHTGAGRVVFHAGVTALITTTLVAGLASTAPLGFKGSWFILVLMGIWLVIRNGPGATDGHLTLDHHGKGAFSVAGRMAVRVELGENHWIGQHCSFVGVRRRGRRLTLLVLPARQQGGEYSRLLVRLRHARKS